MSSNNPLRQYFRQPAIYVRLPSKGQFYTNGTLTMPPTGELPIYPMTAIDEITYRTPDALYNGQATVNVIQSCVPDIKDGWAIPALDVDTLLVSIRIASYGHDMEFGTTCPTCNHEADQVVDLRSVLDHIKAPDYTESLKSGDIEIFFRPMTYKNLSDNNQLQFESQKMLQILPNSEASETDKMNALGSALKRITEITVTALSQSISAIKTPSALVGEPEYISEFLSQCDKNVFNQVRDHILSFRDQSEMQALKIKCDSCGHEYEQPITLDMSSFFERAS